MKNLSRIKFALILFYAVAVAVAATSRYVHADEGIYPIPGQPDSRPDEAITKDEMYRSLLQKIEQQSQELNSLRTEVGRLEATAASATNTSIADQPSIPAAGNQQVNGYEVGTDKSMSASWNNGLELKSKNGDFRMHIGGLVQYDINWLNPDPFLEVPPAVGGIGPDPNSTQIRGARLRMDGTFYEVIDFTFEFDLANDLTPAAPSAGQPVASNPVLTELWVQYTHIPIIGNIRAGNQKEALGLEHAEAIRDISFLEASYLFDMLFGPFNSGFNPGIAILNWTEDQRMTWEFGLWGNNSDAFAYSIGNDWALTGRTTFLVFYDEPSKGRYLWEVGCSGSLRQPDEGLVRLRDRGDIRSGPPGVLNPIYADTGVMGADQQNVVALETFAQWGSWSMQAEYGGTWIDGAVQPILPPEAAVSRGTPYFQGGYIEVLYFLTGDNRTYNKQIGAPARTVPLENAFWVSNPRDGCCHGWGAWQLGARYNAIDLNDNGINGGKLSSFTLGLNWFLTPNTCVQFNYDYTHRGPVKATPAGVINSFGTRMAYNF